MEATHRREGAPLQPRHAQRVSFTTVAHYTKRRSCVQVRQNYGVTIDRGFRPTSNARLSETFAETKRFADALRKFDKYCSAHLKGVKGV